MSTRAWKDFSLLFKIREVKPKSKVICRITKELRRPWLTLRPCSSRKSMKTIQIPTSWWINKQMWYIHTMEYYSSLKRNKVVMKVKVTQSCLTLCDSMGYTVHGILQARILEWVAFPFSRGSSQARSPALQADSLAAEPPGEPILNATTIKVVIYTIIWMNLKTLRWMKEERHKRPHTSLSLKKCLA